MGDLSRTENKQVLSVPIPNPGDSTHKMIMRLSIDGRKSGVEYDPTNHLKK